MNNQNEKISIIRTKCPICGKNATLDFKPFCSKRCADIDLNRWLSGVYRIETNELPQTPVTDTEDK